MYKINIVLLSGHFRISCLYLIGCKVIVKRTQNSIQLFSAYLTYFPLMNSPLVSAFSAFMLCIAPQSLLPKPIDASDVAVYFGEGQLVCVYVPQCARYVIMNAYLINTFNAASYFSVQTHTTLLN